MKVDINEAGTRYTLLESEWYPAYGITVPAGYTTDFASTPKFIWNIYPPGGYYTHSAVLHDYMYDCHHAGNDLVPDRKTADKRLIEQMKRDGVGWRTRITFYVFVRLFGGAYWNKNE